jgi:hypothetical protein
MKYIGKVKIYRINSRNGSESSVTLINELKGVLRIIILVMIIMIMIIMIDYDYHDYEYNDYDA